MIHNYFNYKGFVVLLLGFCLGSATEVFAQRGGGGGGGGRGGGGGGFGGGGFGGGGGGGSRGTTGTRSYYPNGTIGEALISSDPETRTITIVADEETNIAISQVITNLDRPAPQVLIKVAFLEVTHNNGRDLGLEGQWTKNMGGSVTGTVSTIFGAAQATQGGFYKVLGQNFSATLHALDTAGRTEVLSRPSILARNNQLATITVGQSIPLITSSRTDTFGNLINSIAYQDIGIILRVTPFITSDGLVQLIISPEISSLTDQTVPIASNVSAPVIAKRSADTVVVTPDGIPVVIGGLMQNQKIKSTSKLPILGDIPLLGWAFKRQQDTWQKVELIIILLPQIVPVPSQLAALSEHERANAQLTPKAFSAEELDHFLDKFPLKANPVSTVPPAPTAPKSTPPTKGLNSPKQMN